MKEVYAALLLHKSEKPIDEEGIKKVLTATGAEVNESKVKSLVASLKDVDIDKELESAVVASATPAGSGADGGGEKPAKEEKKEEKAEESAAGLSSLFG